MDRRYKKFVYLGISLCLLILAGMPGAFLYGEEFDEAGIKKFGVIHNVAEDRGFERIGGKYEPEGLDKYIKRHFDRLDEHMMQIIQKMDALEQKINEFDQKISELQVAST